MNLRELLGNDAIDASADAPAVSGVALDSRKVKQGDVFFALSGAKHDGARFADQAISNGAVAIVSDQPLPVHPGVAQIVVGNPRRALALASAKIYPMQPGTIVAVTGTSGKTSVAAFARQIWQRVGFSSASIGTIGLVSDARTVYGSLTTPDPIALHRSLDEIARDGVTHLALEASSHGLDQYRLDGVRIAAGGFTNLSRDHMDYHPSVEHYLRAKLRLFTELVIDGGTAVIAADHDVSGQVIAAARERGLRVMTVGEQADKDGLRLVNADNASTEQNLSFLHGERIYEIQFPLLGSFQVENALVAAGLAIATGGDPKSVFAALEHLEGASGRLERIGDCDGASVFIDYAHKPDALEKVLIALKPYAKGKLILVFGAGGDRDAGKRPLMGEIAARLADHVIITDDNPRSENPASIRAAIRAAAPRAQEIGDRAQAIRVGVEMLKRDDVLLIAGKGHETGQLVGDTMLPFSDHDAARAALAARGA